MSASTRIQVPANNSFSFDFKVQWKRCLPWTPYAPQVDLMCFSLDLVAFLSVIPKGIIMSRPITSCGCSHKVLIHTLQFTEVSTFSSFRVWASPVFSVSFSSLFFLFLSPLVFCLTFISSFCIKENFLWSVYDTMMCMLSYRWFGMWNRQIETKKYLSRHLCSLMLITCQLQQLKMWFLRCKSHVFLTEKSFRLRFSTTFNTFNCLLHMCN